MELDVFQGLSTTVLCIFRLGPTEPMVADPLTRGSDCEGRAGGGVRVHNAASLLRQ